MCACCGACEMCFDIEMMSFRVYVEFLWVLRDVVS